MSERLVPLLLGVGVVLFVLALTSPFWALAAYPVSADSIEDTAPYDPIVAFEELDAEHQALVERAIDTGDPPTVYGTYRSYETDDGQLPWMFEDRWVDDHTLGVAVNYEGNHYAVGAPVPNQAKLALIVILGASLGMGLVTIGVLARPQGYRDVDETVMRLLIGLGTFSVLGLLWLGNIHGHVWPIR